MNNQTEPSMFLHLWTASRLKIVRSNNTVVVVDGTAIDN